jgi:hypothetical protein
MGKLDAVPNNPGLFAFRCECGYDKRNVVETERFFTCERPVEAKVPACKIQHEFAPLKAEMEKRYAEAAAKKFLAENEQKVAEAKAILGVKAAPLPPKVAEMAKSIANETQSDIETKVIKRGPGRPRKESK